MSSALMDNVNKIWNIDEESIKDISAIKSIVSTKHGLFASVPIICKGDRCAYKNVCMVKESNRKVGQRCPMEIAAIISRFEMWCKHFGVDISNDTVKDEDVADLALIRDLVENEVQTLRAENRIAISADFIGETIAGIDNKGNEHYEETVRPEVQYKLQLQDKRYKILQLLNATRKDKLAEKKLESNPSTKAMSIFKKVAELLPEDIDNI